jgi:hypothetical protein
MINNPQNLIVHHSITPRDLDIATTERSIQNNHKARGFPLSSMGWNIGYQYIIYGNGEIRQYRQDTEEGAHTKEQEMNFKSIGICLIGDFDKELPSDNEVSSLTQLMLKKVDQYLIPSDNIFPHRKFATYKSCYGNLLSDDWAKKLLTTNIMPIIYKKQGEDTLYVLITNNTLIPITSWDVFLEISQADKIVELSADQFSKFSVLADLAIAKVH